MNKVEKAKVLIKEFAVKLSELTYEAADDSTISMDDRNWLYTNAPPLYAQATRTLGTAETIEAPVITSNAKNIIKIGDYGLTKGSAFDLLLENGEWDTGVLGGSSYGLAFQGSKGSVILVDNMKARVHLPL